MHRITHRIWLGYWTLTAALFAIAVILTFAWTPTEATMGPVQKIFYLHLPAAINTFLACTVVFIASLGYLIRRSLAMDALA
ncbi:MAG: cytochrome C assembly protein, partial [bacterium]